MLREFFSFSRASAVSHLPLVPEVLFSTSNILPVFLVICIFDINVYVVGLRREPWG